MDDPDLKNRGGLAVIAGANGAENALALAKDGRWLVRLLAKDEANADALRTQTESHVGLISVRVEEDLPPFNTDTVNLVVFGPGTTISVEEAKRVLAPWGVLFANGEKK